jgi:hypothetical protein
MQTALVSRSEKIPQHCMGKCKLQFQHWHVQFMLSFEVEIIKREYGSHTGNATLWLPSL